MQRVNSMGTITKDDVITIGQLAARTGVAVSAVRFYEDKGLLASIRTSGNQRRFLRSDIRRVSFILIAHRRRLPLPAKVSALQPRRQDGRQRRDRPAAGPRQLSR